MKRLNSLPAEDNGKLAPGSDSEPFVSVVVPCFNYGHYLCEAVDSIIGQTFQDFEIIIVNDGSTDNTRQVAEELIAKYTGHQIRLLDQENSGHPAIARNNGIATARGEYILPLDADDTLHPEALENYRKVVMGGHSIPKVAFGWLQSFGTDASLWTAGEFEPHQMLRRNQIPSSSMFHRDVWSAQNGYRVHGFEDWAFWVGAVRIGAQFCSVGRVTTYYRKTEEGSRHDTKVKDHEWFIANIIRNNAEVYEEFEVAWARDYLHRHVAPPAEREIHGEEDRFPEAAALLVTSHTERYSQKEVHWARTYLSDHPIRFTKKLPNKVKGPQGRIQLPITAIIAAYNEGDVIFHVIGDLVEQDIRVYLIDHHSTDNTVSQASKWLGKGLLKIEQFPEDAGIRIDKDVYAWRYILQRKEQIASELGPGWYIHADADEFRESPWSGLSLREGIERVDREGFNAINFKIHDFKPTDNSFVPGEDVRRYLHYYDPDIHAFNRVQIKCWKYFGQKFTMWRSGGHSVEFEGRILYPTPFILRHYPIRSQEHGRKKVFSDRKGRFDQQERAAKWHDQYDQIPNPEHDFIRNPSDLRLYEREEACRQVLSLTRPSNSTHDGYYGYVRPEIQAMVEEDAKKILDVGCAAGMMAAALKHRHNAEVWGIELADDIAQVASSNLDRVICGDIAQVWQELPDGYFDTIIFADVLEHLENPYAVLENIKTKLSAGGKVIASIPNVRHWSVLKDLLEGKWDYTDAGILDRTHLRFFTRKSVVELFENAGYAIQDAKATVFGDQVPPSGLIEFLAKAGLEVSSLAEDSKHYQYIVKAAPHQVVQEKQNPDPLVSIVILTCNQLEYTRLCLESILEHIDRPCEIIFVDNGSSDDTAAYLRSQAEMVQAQVEIRLIPNNKNLGFAAGNNQGIAAARGQYVLLMNNDIVVTRGWLDRLLDCADRHPRAGIVGPVSNYVSGPQLVEKVDYDTQSLEGLGDFSENLAGHSHRRDRRMLRVVGFCMLIKRAVIDRIGGMDDRYGLGNFEDDDFSLRATLAGFESWMAEDCFVHHFGSRTFVGEKIDYRNSLMNNWELFKKKWGLPRDLSYEKGYRLEQIPQRTFDPDRHHIPIDGYSSIRTASPGRAPDPLFTAYEEVQALIGEGKTKAAFDRLREIVEANPDFSPAHNDLGILFYQAGNVQKSLEHFRQATRLEPDATTYLKNLADLLCVEFQQFEESLSIYVSVLEKDPLDTETLCNTGHLCRLMGKYEDAEHFYRRVLEIDSQHPEAGKCIQELAAAPASRDAAEKSVGNTAQTPAPSGGMIETRDESPLTSDTGNMPSVSILVLLDGSQGKLKKTLSALQKHTSSAHELLLLDSNSRKSISQWARHQAKQHPDCKVLTVGRRSSTAKAVNRGIEAASGDIIVILSGEVVVFDGWLTDMLACMSQLPDPGVIGPMANIAAGNQRIDLTGNANNTTDQAKAVRAFRNRYHHRWISSDRLEGFCMLFQRRLTAQIGMFDETIDDPEVVDLDFCMRASLAGNTNAIAGDVYVHRSEGSSNIRTMKSTDTQLSLLTTQSESGNRILTLLAVEKGRRAFQKGDADAGVTHFFDGIRLSPGSGYVYYRLAECLMNARRYSEALDVLGELPPESGHLRRIELQAYAHEGLENWDEADRLAEQALALNPNSAAATNLKGVLAHRQGLGEKAEACYRRAMELAPGFADPYTNLGALKWEPSPKEAIELFEKAFVFNPDSTDIANNYHTAIASVGDYERAETIFKSAARHYADNRNIHFKTIDVLLKQDKLEDAMEAIELAVCRFGPDDDMLAAAHSVRKRLDAQMEDTGKPDNCSLSLCMIVKNEEKDIGRCLHSIKPVVDEMIVVDTGSEDRTREIARVFGAKVFDIQWADDFAAARNFAIEKASGAWTFHLDADEVVSRLDHQALRKLVQRTNASPIAYIFTTRNYTRDITQVGWQANDNRYVDEEAGSGWTPSDKVRLFPRNENIRFEFPVHELVEPSLMRGGIPMKTCPIPIHHYGKLNQKRSIEKEEAYYAIGRRKLAEMGDDTVALHELAIQAANLGRHAEAIDLWQRFVTIHPDNPLAFINMGNAYCRLGDFEAMRQTAEKALALDPELKEAHYNYALAMVHLSRADEAAAVLEKLLERIDAYPLARFLLAVAYSLARRSTDSTKTFKKLKQSPAGPGLAGRCREFARELAERGNMNFALALLESAMDSGIHGQQIQDFHQSLLKAAASRGPDHPAGGHATDTLSLGGARNPAAFEPRPDSQVPF